MRNDSGESYIELLVTLVIIGLAGVAILGAVMTSITSSSEHRNLANDDTIMKSAVEQVKYEIELAPAPLFSDCGSGGATAGSLISTWNSGMSSLWPAIPGGIGSYKAWISNVECFTESSTASAPDPNCQASMASASAPVTNNITSGCTSDLSGIVQVTVSVLDQSNLVSSMTTLVRNPSYGSSYKVANF